MSDLVEYYRERAEEYGEICRWRDPHRQKERLYQIRQLRGYMRYIQW